MDNLNELLDQGYSAEEVELIAHVVKTAEMDRVIALRTGRCTCSTLMVRHGARIECPSCGEAFVA